MDETTIPWFDLKYHSNVRLFGFEFVFTFRDLRKISFEERAPLQTISDT